MFFYALSLKLATNLLVVAVLVTSPALCAASSQGGTADKAISTTRAQTGSWSTAELQSIIKADDLKVSPFREDGVTYGTPTWIWCVEVDGSLYVRAYNGKASRWYQAAMREKAGRVIAAGMTREVTFEPVDGDINDRIDDAYRAKYSSSPYLEPMINDRACGATVRINPQIGGS
ncbi:DUF2255 family protein [Pseudomonas syringae]|uniref:Lipoprotein n=2 Tax=Pseudomonas syringae TaxID=317 RepID=A0A656JHY7_PSESF|nr:DUF2255 family protein [Pseudomonas syringae]EPN26492.1 hypothetical protein A245_48150 [Pseudomonas syringae pv. actinidiae ICMP 19096]EPM45298.1 hypothetical protein A246_19773 [Pseudomonas syringae pv. actinidiae ICMP 19098]EPM84790.1 hypothetical protein A249_27995 [Pseudomonas syringae pv. actinidiae ICMP 18804]EPN19652.1 hypothetical protein A248_09274 [Pseudomonas syringae pv. actinidiae ICMP 19100]EPN24667.1 hypothetical protein A247_19727 [Pseudomonas syringae pv. actinidiae ICMP 1